MRVQLACLAMAAGAAGVSAQTTTSQPAHRQTRGIKVIRAGEAGSDTPVTPTAVQTAPAQSPTPPAAPAPMTTSAACMRPVAAPDLRLGNDSVAASQLAARLRRGNRVSIELATPYPARAETPPPLSPWLSAVKASGGSVDIVPYCDKGSRGFFKSLSALFGPADPGKAYRPARNYNVVLHNDVRSRTITQVEFVPRMAGAAKGR